MLDDGDGGGGGDGYLGGKFSYSKSNNKKINREPQRNETKVWKECAIYPYT